MKKLLATAGPAYYRMCSTDVYYFKTNRQQWHQGENHHPSFLRFWNWAGKLSMQPKFVAAQKMLLNETRQTFVNGLLGFITLSIYTPLEARVYCSPNNCMGAHRYGQLYLHCSLIYFWVPSSCFA